MSEAARLPFRRWQFAHFLPFGADDRWTIIWAIRWPGSMTIGLVAEIDRDHLDLAAIIGIDGAGTIDQGHALL